MFFSTYYNILAMVKVLFRHNLFYIQLYSNLTRFKINTHPLKT